ncbi:MAG TPA: hypothetical protein VM889_07155 [Candidatus Thermoplasmatota archaeon]|nr:hypothetical protein [Candidatus Thermoplasmatota archaeon]
MYRFECRACGSAWTPVPPPDPDSIRSCFRCEDRDIVAWPIL